ncbi:MAG TPA: prolipoprotein diacylglyceryl transferase [Coriobacteriia bacterium]|nr:prolipoprotein diacylglyceryl transferase [Coriobacteriia bacterium]
MLNDIYQMLDPVAFTIGPFAVRWYGLGYILGFALAGLLAYKICKRWKIKFTVDGILILMIASIIGTVLGGRLGYVLFYGEGYYFQHPESIFNFSQGGMSFHGGLIGFAIGAIISARINKMPIGTLAEICGICTPIGLGLVRIANFINGELWGKTTDLPWGVIFESGGALPRHPSQLYEAFLEGAVLLLILYLLSRRSKLFYRGTYFGIFLIGYAVFRIAVEFVRLPDAHIGYLLGTEWLTMGMVLSLPMVAVGIGFIVYALKTKHPQMGMEMGEMVAVAEDGGEVHSRDDADREVSIDDSEEEIEASVQADSAAFDSKRPDK